MKLTRNRIAAFQKKIFSWWKINKRDLPWRHTHDPYKILVSEVMLQQTQVFRVLPKYREFIERYPTINDLATASPAAVIRLWKGMGYNRRALYLHKTARIIVEKYNSQLPISEQLLSKLPGLGTYTARAILVFAFKQEVPLVDTNIRQIIKHFFLNSAAKGPALRGHKACPPVRQGRVLEKEVEIIARQLIPQGKSWEWHQALMDFGALALSVPRNSGIHSAHIIRNSRLQSTHIIRNSRLQSAPGPLQRKALSFRQSNRFYRGRIIDLLRVQEISETKLLQELIHQYQKPKAFLDPIIASLLSDGLIERVKPNILRLPEA